MNSEVTQISIKLLNLQKKANIQVWDQRSQMVKALEYTREEDWVKLAVSLEVTQMKIRVEDKEVSLRKPEGNLGKEIIGKEVKIVIHSGLMKKKVKLNLREDKVPPDTDGNQVPILAKMIINLIESKHKCRSDKTV